MTRFQRRTKNEREGKGGENQWPHRNDDDDDDDANVDVEEDVHRDDEGAAAVIKGDIRGDRLMLWRSTFVVLSYLLLFL